jgi:hypothetical protein
MKLDISKVELSKNDIKRELKLPREMTESLAENIGIMIGDGHIGLYKNKRGAEYPIIVSGNAKTDKHYLSEYVKKLNSNLYNLDFPVSVVGKNKTEIRLKICSKGLVYFYSEIIGLPINKKDNLSIPKCLWTKDEHLAACLRGIFDTDGSLQFKKKVKYPVLSLNSSSRKLIIDCQKALVRFDINANIYCDIERLHSKTKKTHVINELYINGRKNLAKFIERIGFSNERNLEKIRAHGDSNPGPMA